MLQDKEWILDLKVKSLRNILMPLLLFAIDSLDVFNRLGSKTFFNKTSQISECCSAQMQAVTRRKKMVGIRSVIYISLDDWMSKIRLASIILPQKALLQTRYSQNICPGPVQPFNSLEPSKLAASSSSGVSSYHRRKPF